MKYIFDASSIYFLIKKDMPEQLASNYANELTRFEVCNILIKEERIRKVIDKDEQANLLNLVARALNFMTIIDIKGAEQEIINVANEYNLSFYDASYVYLAVE